MGIRTRGYHPAISAMRESMLFRQELREEAWASVTKLNEHKQLTKTYWLQRLGNALADLKTLDLNWEAWFDDNNNVPEEAGIRKCALLVEDRVREIAEQNHRIVVRTVARLYRGVFIWRDQSGFFIFGEDGKIYEHTTETEAQAMIDATLAMCGRLAGALG